uniref:Putative neuraminidase n=1 Tax=viral metagenome TaxID=1070528 RepID=A0A6M3MHT6_9ZZZZ
MARRRQYLERMKDVFFRNKSKYDVIVHDVDPPWRNVWRNQAGSTLPEHPDWGEWGANWSEAAQLGDIVYALTYLGNGIVLAGTGWNEGIVYRSVDGGLTWSSVGRLGDSYDILSLTYLGNGVVLAYTGEELYRSADYGLTWGVVAGLPSSLGAFANLGNGGVVAGAYPAPGEIYRSADYGLTWVKVAELGAKVSVRSLQYLGGSGLFIGVDGAILAGTQNWAVGIKGEIYYSADNGNTWANGEQFGGLTGWTEVKSLAYLGGGVVIAGTRTGGVNPDPGKIYRSADYGLTWGVVANAGDGGGVHSLVNLGFGIALAGLAWGAGGGVILRSVDGGLTWSSLGYFGDGILCLTYLGLGVVLAGGGDDPGKIFRSVHHHV